MNERFNECSRGLQNKSLVSRSNRCGRGEGREPTVAVVIFETIKKTDEMYEKEAGTMTTHYRTVFEGFQSR